MRTDLKELFETVEKIRSEHYASLPKGLVGGILEIEAEFCDDKAEASKHIAKLIDSYLDRGGDIC